MLNIHEYIQVCLFLLKIILNQRDDVSVRVRPSGPRFWTTPSILSLGVFYCLKIST